MSPNGNTDGRFPALAGPVCGAILAIEFVGIRNLLKTGRIKSWHGLCIETIAHRMSRSAGEAANGNDSALEMYCMKAAPVTTILGLILLSGALLAAASTRDAETGSRAKAEFERLDRDGDDRVSRGEAESNPGLATHFARFDGDSDGTLEWHEFLRHEELSASGSRDAAN